MTEPVYAATIAAYSHGGAFRPDPPAFHVIHSTEGPMADGNARGLAGPNWFGGPKAGTSATDIFDPLEAIKMLDDHTVPYHCGPQGNGLATGSEHCGSVSLTKEQWLSDRAKSMLDRSARRGAQRAHERGWSLADCRWLSVSEVAQRTVKGFCTHNDVRLALGGTTHSDPGPNFPYDWYIARVRFWYANPNGAEEDMGLDATDKAWITGELKRVGLRVAATALSGGPNSVVSAVEAKGFANISLSHATYLLMYGDNANDATDAGTHPNNIQRIRAVLEPFVAASTARENALVDALAKVAAAGGVPITSEQIADILNAAVDRGFANLDLHLVPAEPAQPVSVSSQRLDEPDHVAQLALPDFDDPDDDESAGEVVRVDEQS